MAIYNFPARREEIEGCNDIKQLQDWKGQFALTLKQIENDYDGEENFPENVHKFFTANKYNLKTIDFKIRLLARAVSPFFALKCFHDKVRDTMPNEYWCVVEETLAMLGQPDANWDDLITPKPKVYPAKGKRKRISHDL